MRNLIIKTKFLPPSSPKNCWIDDKLWQKYNQIKNYPLTLVKAGPGYGKSTTLSLYFKENFDQQFYWYSIDELDADPALFFLNLIHAFKFKKDNIGAEAIKLLNKGDQEISIKQSIDLLLNELLNKLKKETFLVLDDFHLVNDNPQIKNLFVHFIKNIPPQLHVIIASRQKINFKELPELRLKKKILLIEESDLTLDENDIREFLLTTYNLELNQNEINKLKIETEGWIMAIDLIGEGIKNGADLNNIFKKDTNSLKLLFQYLAFEILDNQEEEIKNFLLKSAVLKYLRPAICNKVLDINNSKEILENIYNKGLFIYSQGDRQYRYHHLFHEFLKEQGQRVYNYKKLHQKAADICEDIGENGFAIYHSLEADNEEKAATLISSSASKLLEKGRIETLQAGLDRLSINMFEKYPSLYLYQGDIYRLRSYFNKALEAYKKAKNIFQESNDRLNLSRSLQKIAMIYLDTVQPVQAEKYLKKALKLRDEENLWEEASILKLMAENKANEGHLRQAEKLQQQAKNISDITISNNNFKARVKLRTGKLNRAQSILEEKVNQEKEKKRTPKSHRETILVLSLIHSFKGESTPAKNYAQGGIYLGQQFYSPFIRAIAYMRLGHAYQLMGRHRTNESRDAYQKSLEIIEKFKIPRGKAEPLMGLSLLEAFYGNTDKGISYGKEGIIISEEAGDEWVAGLNKIGLGINHFFAENLEKAEEIFLNNSKTFLNLNDRFCLTVCKLWLSLIYYHRQKKNKFILIAKELFKLVQKENFEFIFYRPTLLGADNPNLLVPILLEAREEDIKKEYIKSLLAELELSDVEHHPGYTLRIEAFGNLRVWRGKEEINKKEWEREKAKELFLLLLIHRGELIPKEKIYFYLWPDKSEKKAARNFKVTLNALKKALEPNRKPRQTPFFINRRGSSYGFNDNAGYTYDVEKFEELINSATKADNIGVKIKNYQAAVDLYQDDFIVDKLYIDWIRNERERLRNIFLNNADKLMVNYFKQAKYEKCLEIGNKILEIDNCWENAYYYKMKSYNKMEKRSMAIKVFKKCKSLLDKELNVFPSTKLKNYYQKLINDS